MTELLELSPLGTAQAVLESETVSDEVLLLDWLWHVRENLKACYNVEDEVGFLAWELARWQPGLELAERQALILLILSALVQLRLGSTRLAVRNELGQAIRPDLVSQLLAGITTVREFETFGHAQVAGLMERLFTSSASMIIGHAGSFKPLVIAGPYLYLQKMLQLEDQFVEVIRHRLSTPILGWPEQEIDRALSDVLSRPVSHNTRSIILESEQQEAVRSAVCYPMTIISGGPGTGKTTIIVSVLRVLRRLGVTCEEIALAAPTGKAANRMGESIRAGRAGIADPAEADLQLASLGEPQTLHRLLGFSPRSGHFLYHENNRISERIVIVDEGSMVDLTLMERLVRSLREDSRLIVLGDARQLPSVEVGAVLRDLLDLGDESVGVSAALRRIRLTVSHRMRREDDDGRNIFTVAQAIDQGLIPELATTRTRDEVITERISVQNIEFRGVEFLVSPAGCPVLNDFLTRWHRESIRSLPDLDQLIVRAYSIDRGKFASDDQDHLERLFAHWGRSRILCVTRVLATGAHQINAVLHQLAINDFPQSKHGAAGFTPRRNSELIPGEPVMMTVNDYNRKIFNGDQGLVVNVSEQDRLTLMVVFPQPQGFVAFPAESLRPHLQHSYAMTVHKAQGSEFDRVAIILPDRDLPINTREILYTALTRSRTSAVLVGRQDILMIGVARGIARESGIAEKLRDAFAAQAD